MQICMARGGFTSECHIHLAQALCPAAMCRMMAAAHMGSCSDDDLWHCVNAQTHNHRMQHIHTQRRIVPQLNLLDALNAVARKPRRKSRTKERAEWSVIKEEVEREKNDNGISVNAKTRQKPERERERQGLGK